MSVQPDFMIKKGGSLSHQFTAKDAGGTVIDITGFSITAKARFKDAPAAVGKVTLSVTMTNPSEGLFTISLTSNQTRSMAVGIWEFDAKLDSGSVILTTETMTFEILEPIT